MCVLAVPPHIYIGERGRGAARGVPSRRDPTWALMTHKYRGSIVVLSISKSVKPNEEQKEMISGFQ